MVKITTIKQKYYIANVTKENIDAKLKECLDGIKDEVNHKGYGDFVITVDIRFMTGKETDIHVNIERK